jgi:hypothetical protein
VALARHVVRIAIGSAQRKLDLHGEALLRSSLGEQGGVVGGRNGADDREPEAMVAVAWRRAVGTEALEGLEQPLHLGGRDDGNGGVFCWSQVGASRP